ncbi:helix-turn-helix domain-containing protein [Bifidobacterium sp. ESL0763]|uniref:helix-turn-helix domain-containing protein n=1 Tax=Bifidobacterium sp. ESL0763 TaxID=2983227 RepID=UPI0023F813C7|nr:helix-turn-helix domain-containing protein [Bifidobacterium sp. ESL0763]MDF7663812.1 helix-turn-helix domain-containing protein [Bifidobacterium sp. ESL0763]
MAVIEARPVRSDAPYVLQGDGKTYQLDRNAFQAAMEAAKEASDTSRTIGTGEAARILGVSRKTVQRMLDANAIPYRRNGEGGNRMMRQADVISYAETMRSDRRAALDDLRDQAEDMGLYDMPDAGQEG